MPFIFIDLMKKLAILLLQLIFVNSLYAQNMTRVRKHIDTLAAPGMHGRGYVNDGDKIAAKFIRDRYLESGLLTFNDTTQGASHYFQPFKLDVNRFHFAYFKINGVDLELGKDFLIHPASRSIKGNSSKILYLDSLIFTDKKFQKKFLQKKIHQSLLVFPSSYTKKIFTLPKEILTKLFEANAFIELVDGKLVYSVATYQYGIPYFQVKKDVFPKKIKCIDLGAASDFKENYVSQNVIGYIKGKSKPDSFIVVSAHYDHLGRIRNVYFPGANDNASGISMMLELADHYSKAENYPDYSIVFMAFGAEEAGLIGSKYYVENPLFPLKKIKFLINLDLLGTGDEGITVVNATKFPEHYKRLSQLNEEKKYLPAIKSRGPAANSDHYFFTEKGVPAFFIYTMGGISAYHDIYDKAETLPLTKFKEVFRLLTDYVEGF